MYIPDLTERYPEGFDGVDMCVPRDLEYEFWKAADSVSQVECEGCDKPRRAMWISYYLQDGTQGMATIMARDFDDADRIMRHEENEGEMFGEIVDYMFYDEM
jgi:hypothetical protein